MAVDLRWRSDVNIGHGHADWDSPKPMHIGIQVKLECIGSLKCKDSGQVCSTYTHDVTQAIKHIFAGLMICTWKSLIKEGS